jgi:hypothetical protein
MQPSNAAIEMSSLNCDGMRIPSPVSASLVPYFIGELPAGAAAQVEDNIFQYPIDVDPNNAAGNYIAETDNDNNSTTVTLNTSQNRGNYFPSYRL